MSPYGQYIPGPVVVRFGTDLDLGGGLSIIIYFISFSAFLEESVAGGVIDPGVLVGASHTCVQVQGLAGKLVCGQLAAVG